MPQDGWEPMVAGERSGFEPCFRSHYKRAVLPEWKKRHFRRALLDRIEGTCGACEWISGRESPSWWFTSRIPKPSTKGEDGWQHQLVRKHRDPWDPVAEEFEPYRCRAGELWDQYVATFVAEYDWTKHEELWT